MSPEPQLTRQEKIELSNRRINKIMFMPILLLVGLVPLIVRCTEIKPTEAAVYVAFAKSEFYDFFSQYKASAIISISVIMLVIGFFFFKKEELKKGKLMKIYAFAGLAFAAVSIIATFMSAHRYVALWGVYDRAEGLVVQLCYLFMFAYTIYTFKEEKSYQYIIIALSIVVSINLVLGICQYAGRDLLAATDLGKKLVIPEKYATYRSDFSAGGSKGVMYGTMYHYNYMGSFGAMMVPLFAVLTAFTHNIKKRSLSGVMLIFSVILLLGSKSRAGLIGLACAIIVGIIIFGKELLKRWKIMIIALVGAGVLVVGLNAVTNGSIFARIPSLFADMKTLVFGSEQVIDYRDQIPVRAVKTEEGKVVFTLQNETLTFSYDGEKVQTTDQAGQSVAYLEVLNLESGTDVKEYYTEDPRFNFIKYKIGQAAPIGESTLQDALAIDVANAGFFTCTLDATKGVTWVDDYSLEPITTDAAPSIGFKGKEKIGSMRGYIWSRALPIFLEKNLLIGNGPDTFVMNFPKNDVLAKWYAYGATNNLVDKAHNLYLQIGMNNGGLALIAFLVMMITYMVDCFKIYALKRNYSSLQIIGIATFLAVVGYLGAGLFNDSVISVAPIFWILLGTGVAINYLVHAEIKKTRKIVNMKNYKQ